MPHIDADIFEGIAVTWNAAAIGGLLDLNHSESVNVIDNTDAEDTVRRKLAGLPDSGQLTLTVKFVADDATQMAMRTDMRAGTMREVVISWTDGGATTYTFNAILTGMSVKGSLDDKMVVDITMEIDGGITEA